MVATSVIQRINIFNLLMMFVVYIVIHIIIAIKHKEYGELVKEKPGNEKIEQIYKLLTILNKWFAFAYLIFVLLTMA